MKTIAELDQNLASVLRPLVEKLKAGGPIRWLAYLRLVWRIFRRWTPGDHEMAGVLEERHGEDACNEAFALLLGEAGILDTDGVYTWAKG